MARILFWEALGGSKYRLSGRWLPAALSAVSLARALRRKTELDIEILIGWVAVAFLAVYMFSIVRLFGVLKREWWWFWEEKGAPSITDPNGQIKIFSLLVLGFGLDDGFREKNKLSIVLLRVSFVGASLLFLLIGTMIYLGAYN